MPERHVGTSLGRFRIDALIGSGGFAWVYKGYDPELDIPVAIKVLKPQFAGDETFESRFRREAATAAKLRHPNIVRILAVGRQEKDVYFVMDFLPHGLVDRLRVMGTFPDNLILRLGLDVSAALAFAHREGVIHRDIKTDNILFDDHGNAVVADFGIARAVSGYTNQTGTNMVVGTPQYFSPEQARGLALDGRADIYSLGVTLFKAATGVLPFQGDDWYEIARQHVEDEPPRPRSFNPAISREVERLILRCLEKDAELRYNTADALRADLTQLQAQSVDNTGSRTIMMATPRESDTIEVGLWGAIKRRVGSRPVRIAFLGAVMALVLVAGLSRGLGDGRRIAAPPTNGTGNRPIPPAPREDSVVVTPPPSPTQRLRPTQWHECTEGW
ncbi:MAG: serine/threonine-protein kinase [Gemmatimonadaceae bacterium]